MNAHTQSCNDSKLGIKAYQNLVGSLNAFDRLTGLIAAGDHILLSSVFCFAVVKYAKPFVDTETPFGKARYPVRQLKKEEGFSAEIHSHLLELRNTLVAHDDLESIEPRILQFCLSVNPSGFSIPMSIAVSNKCLAYPVDSESVLTLRTHVAACVQGVLNKIHSDLARIRDAVLKHPEQVAEGMRYQKNYGQTRIEKNGSHLQPPDFMRDEWLNSSEPDFSHIHNGMLYEELRVRRDFYGPERIKLPDGSEVQISLPNINPSVG
jgi:hypothetical protein